MPMFKDHKINIKHPVGVYPRSSYREFICNN